MTNEGVTNSISEGHWTIPSSNCTPLQRTINGVQGVCVCVCVYLVIYLGDGGINACPKGGGGGGGGGLAGIT